MSDRGDNTNRNVVSHLVHDALDSLHHLRILGRGIRRAGKPPGTPPGTVVHTGLQRVEEVAIQAMRFGAGDVVEERWTSLPDDLQVPDAGEGVLWINVTGLHESELLLSLGRRLSIHPLALEDVASVGQRPKLEDYGTHLFIVLHMLRMKDDPFRILDEQVSVVVGPGLLLTFQEEPGDVFEPVRERIRSGKGQIRNRGSDYLAYALIDALVDSYFQVMERLGERMDDLEIKIVEAPEGDAMHQLHHLKREVLVLRRSVWPVRELMSAFMRVEGGLVEGTTRVYLRDIYDHSYQLIDTVEILRDLSAGLKDLYLSSVSNRTNEVMKVLTIMASIFIPLTFIAGVYGMNFEYMPELAHPWAYPAVLLLMLGVVAGMLGFFRHRGWI
jgi:magnesium transporter